MNLAVTAWGAIGALVFGVGSAVSSAPNARIVQTSMVHEPGSNLVETAVEAGAFNTLASALTAAELVEPLASGGPFTVFAPTDDAFGKLDQDALANTLQPASRPRLQQVLKYHVVEGEFFAKDLIGGRTLTTLSGQRIRVGIAEGEVRVNDSVITATDIRATNGVIHVIDSVLIPTKQTIVDVASEAGQFKTLLAAAEAAGLVDALSGAGSLTVFAPTDEAFANLPDGTVESLLRPENREALKSLLLYHVVEGPVFASDAIAARSAKTINGEAVETSLRDGALFIDESRVLANDIEASNGVVHVIDRVLIPRQPDGPLDRRRSRYRVRDRARCTTLQRRQSRGLRRDLRDRRREPDRTEGRSTSRAPASGSRPSPRRRPRRARRRRERVDPSSSPRRRLHRGHRATDDASHGRARGLITDSSFRVNNRPRRFGVGVCSLCG